MKIEKSNLIEVKRKNEVLDRIPTYSVKKAWRIDEKNTGVTVRYVKVDADRIMPYIGMKDVVIRYINARHSDGDAKNRCYAVKMHDVDIDDEIHAYIDCICFGMNKNELDVLSSQLKDIGAKCPCAGKWSGDIYPLAYLSQWKKSMKENMKNLAEAENWRWLK